MIVALFFGTWGVIRVVQAVADPWLVSLTGQPTLVGYWEGAMPDKRQFALKLYEPPGGSSCYNCPEIAGDGKVCGDGYLMTYSIYGNPKNYRGTLFELSSTAASRVAGTHLGEIDGSWDGDRLEIRLIPLVVDADLAVRSDHQPDEPTVFEMHRTTKAVFAAACG